MDLRSNFVSFGDRHIAHVVTKAGDLCTLPVGPGTGGADPDTDLLLGFLLLHAGEVVSRTRIAAAVWDHDFDTCSNVVEVYVRYLRAKIDEPSDRPLIHTVRGVGYKAEVKNKSLVLSLGYSTPIEYPIPEGIKIAIDKQTRVTVSGIDRQQVGQVAAEIRGLRKPDPYKQKGIRYVGEVLKKKAGKAGATTGAK